jgi:hypothetical protein
MAELAIGLRCGKGAFRTFLTQIVRSAHDHDRIRVGGSWRFRCLPLRGAERHAGDDVAAVREPAAKTGKGRS